MSLGHISVEGARQLSTVQVLRTAILLLCISDNSFGDPTRIDYGTGHENTFIAFLLCLSELGLVNEDDHKAIVTRVFAKYISLMRRLQTLYWWAKNTS